MHFAAPFLAFGLVLPSGPLGLPCGWGGSAAPTKETTGLVLGYIYGFAEAKDGPSLSSEQVQLAEQVETICHRNPSTTLREIAREILQQKGIKSAPTNGTP